MKAMTHYFKQLSLSRLTLTTTSIFSSSIAAMLTLKPHHVDSRLHGYCAEVPGLLAPDSLSNFIIIFFFWLTDPKSEDAFDNKRKKKRGWPTLKLICDKLTRTHCSLLVFSSRNYKFICNLPIRQFSPQQTWWRSEVCHVSTPKYVSPIAKTVNKIKKGIFPS